MTFATIEPNSAPGSVPAYDSDCYPSDDDDDDPPSNASLHSDSSRIRYHVACGTENEENRKRLRAKASLATLTALKDIDERKIVDESRATGDMRSLARDKDVEYEIYCKLSRQAGDVEPVTSMAPEEENWVKYGMDINERAKLASLGDPRLCRWEATQKELDQYDVDRYRVLMGAARRLDHDTETLSDMKYICLVQERQGEDGDDYAFEPTPTGLTRDEEIRAMNSLLKVDATNYSSAMTFSKQAASNWPGNSHKAVAKYRARQNIRAEILQMQHQRLCEADAKKSKETLAGTPSLPATIPARDLDITKSFNPNDWESQTAEPYIPDPDPFCPPSDYFSPNPSRHQRLQRLGRLLFRGRRHKASPNGLSRVANLDRGSVSEKGR
jgi:hypothetical protein